MQHQGLGQTPDRGMVDGHLNLCPAAGLGLEADEGVCRKVVHVDLHEVKLFDVGEP